MWVTSASFKELGNIDEHSINTFTQIVHKNICIFFSFSFFNMICFLKQKNWKLFQVNVLGVIHLWRPQKSQKFWPHLTTTRCWPPLCTAMDLHSPFPPVSKEYQKNPPPKTPSTTICKIIQNFVITPTSFFVDVINEYQLTLKSTVNITLFKAAICKWVKT